MRTPKKTAGPRGDPASRKDGSSLWSRLRLRRLPDKDRVPRRTQPAEEELSRRAELFGVSQLVDHARILAARHDAAVVRGHERLLHQLAESERGIRRGHETIAGSVRLGRRIAPAAEWLFDNSHLIQEQIELARAHLSPGYSRALPRLKSGPRKGFPRIYDTVLELVRHTDGQVDLENLSRFVKAYQEVQPLTLGELWAVPIMLRLTLIENLHRVTKRIAWRRRQRDAALLWAERFLKVLRNTPRQFVAALGDFVRADPPLTAPFVAELIANIDGVDPALGLALNWLEQELSNRGQTIEQIQQSENQAQAANHVTTRNCITSMRALAAIDWRDFVEALSVTEAVLRRDPAGVYPLMDFRTRNRYRDRIEELARQSGRSEVEAAETAVAMAAERRREGAERRESHVGFFLIDADREALEARLGCRLSLRRRLGRLIGRRPLAWYLLAIAAASITLATVPLASIAAGGIDPPAMALLAVAWAALSGSAVTLINWIVTLAVPPRFLPGLDFSRGIPAEHRTIVVVPTLLGPPAAAARLLDDLEIRFMANRVDNLHFALLTDMPDAETETLPDDRAWLDTAVQGIRRLNRRHARDGETKFFLLHRPRRWNPAEGKWMGRERKRGKLEDFNRLVVEGQSDSFEIIEGDTAVLRTVRYVITLDTDTQLPPGSAYRMAGAMAHLLNRPRLDSATRLVTCGYGVLQPRVAVSLMAARQSLFSRLQAGVVGLDPYTREVSNVYQDLFGQGSYVGKGIYDVHAFHVAVGSRFPDNRILSHDLIEGHHARCGFLSAVELYENEPSRYLADMNRRHRWIRGDWQIARWLCPRAPGPGDRLAPNPLGALARWTILDNLRRSLVPPALCIALAAAAFLRPEFAARWIAGLLTAFFLPAAARSARAFLQKPRHAPLRIHLRHAAATELRQWAADALQLACLPHRSAVCLDAIARAAWRLRVRRRLLEWKTASHSERAARLSLPGVAREMWTAPAFALACGAGLALAGVAAGAVPFLLCGVWAASPVVAWYVSRSAGGRRRPLGPEQVAFLRGLARRTWAYFEHFVGPEHNWLPPDNVQEAPESAVANRTSPTNIGMTLAAGLAAYDFGYISAGRLAARTESTMEVLERLERYRGHFYNWYDTRTLQPLRPLYISTVDSGNLAGLMIVVREGLAEMLRAAILPVRWKEGIEDTAAILLHEFRAAERAVAPAVAAAASARIRELVAAARNAPPRLRETLGALDSIAEGVAGLSAALAPDEIVSFWLASLRRQCADLAEELRRFAPWVCAQAVPDLPAPADDDWDELRGELERIPALDALATLRLRWEPRLARAGAPESAGQWLAWLRTASERAAERTTAIRKLADRCSELSEHDLDFLYDQDRRLLSIGFNLDARKRDPGYYDLLASECRLGSYVSLARGHLPLEHWFHLGRRLVPGGGAPVLVSWSGSMFEYLMPLLVMPSYEGTLLHETYEGAVRLQIRYARRLGLPWGISESCYNQVDSHQVYQYRAFGVPALGMKRGLADDLVIAPYAGAMALMVAPKAAARNLERLVAHGALGRFGLYEALDWTPSRLRTTSGEPFVLVRSWMTHHGGMTLLALDYALNDKPMQRRFLADPQLKSAQLLLQERIPLARPRLRAAIASAEAAEIRKDEKREAAARTFETPDTPAPEVHLLSNGRYHVMVTNSGGGFSRWQRLALTRWREDATRDRDGIFFYLHEVDSGHVWSAAHQPVAPAFDRYEAVFEQGSAEFRSEIHQILTRTTVAVCPEDDMELRAVAITNLSRRARTIEITSFAEVVLLDGQADASHPAFHKLFLRAEPIPDKAAILFTRRPRSSEETPPWMFHAMTVAGGTVLRGFSFETDRAAFIGRGRSVRNPAALDAPGPLPDRTGVVLDPIAAIRYRVRVEAGQTANINAFIGVASTRSAAEVYVDRCRDPRMVDRVFSLAWTRNQVLLDQLRASEADVQLYTRLAGSILYAGPQRRARASVITRNRKNQAALWSHGISGDRPIVLLSIADQANLDLVRNLVQAHSYWRQKGLETDLVIWSEAYAGYRQTLLDAIIGLVHAGTEAKLLDQPGGIFVRAVDQLSEDDRTLLLAVARVVLSDRFGSLAEQIDRRVIPEIDVPELAPPAPPEKPPAPPAPLPPRDLEFFNGYGGFTRDGREYVIMLQAGAATPAPWVNVLANRDFGTIVSESGAAYTWHGNAHLFRLTPWHNDPVEDPGGEAFYLRDDETGRVWSPTPQPAGDGAPYVCRHGHGYTVFEHLREELFSEMTVYTAVAAPIKFAALTLKNLSDRTRRVSVAGYCEWVLGERRDQSAMHVVTQLDPQSGAIFARNAFSLDFADRVAFFHSSASERTVTSSRAEFIGRNGSLAAPAALGREHLSNRIVAAVDPCAAIMALFDIPPGEQIQVVFALGAAGSEEEARGLLLAQGGVSGARQALEEVWRFWQQQLGAVYVETPDQSVNFLVNHWLLYQILSSRFWGRSGFYQSGGAYGFRDQLQDSLAFLHECPWLTREHLLLSAGRQFAEGDVQHWWHPPVGRGVRTRISDDLLWLPFVACRYTAATGDIGVFDEQIPFLAGRALAEGEESVYDQPRVSEERATLYEHCARAIRRAMRFGVHGLPLMGTGDWNDGMNRVGREGRGESVWLGFFLHRVLKDFAELAARRGDREFAERCAGEAERLAADLDDHAWDGRWYLRAFFDDGTPLGSARNQECRIDSLPQSWAVLSAAGDPERARAAMRSAVEHLVDTRHRFIRLFAPPFDSAETDPGYIKGYVPGVRENGAQYTHAAVWVAMAYAALRETDKAWELFQILNPIRHGDRRDRAEVYRIEPYVIAADVYAAAGREGAGGWSWYTGSAAWLYQLLVEGLLGLRIEGDLLSFAPLLPGGWSEFKVTYRYRNTFHHITVKKAGPETWSVRRVWLDGVEQPHGKIRLADDGHKHEAFVEVG